MGRVVEIFSRHCGWLGSTGKRRKEVEEAEADIADKSNEEKRFSAVLIIMRLVKEKKRKAINRRMMKKKDRGKEN